MVATGSLRVTRVAAIDCGTNSLRLLVTDLDPVAQRADELARRTTIVRLGEDVDRTGRFADAALRRTFAALDDYAAMISELGVDRVRMVATSAARDVDNREDFIAGVVSRVGVEPEVITGAEEAGLSYEGTMRGLAGVEGIADPVVVLDVGGGSTELVTRGAGSGDVISQSLDVGSVRVTERCLPSDPATASEIEAATAYVTRAVATLDQALTRAGTLVGVAGTTRTVAAVSLGLQTYDRVRLHLVRIAAGDIRATRDRLLAMTVAKRTAMPVMAPGRADVIGGGAIVLAAVVDRLQVDEVLVSRHDILDGIAWSLV